MYRESDVPDQSGKTFFVTGANTGIGYDASSIRFEIEPKKVRKRYD